MIVVLDLWYKVLKAATVPNRALRVSWKTSCFDIEDAWKKPEHLADLSIQNHSHWEINSNDIRSTKLHMKDCDPKNIGLNDWRVFCKSLTARRCFNCFLACETSYWSWKILHYLCAVYSLHPIFLAIRLFIDRQGADHGNECPENLLAVLDPDEILVDWMPPWRQPYSCARSCVLSCVELRVKL